MGISGTIRHAALGLGAIAIGCGLMVADVTARHEASRALTAMKLIAHHGIEPAARALLDRARGNDSDADGDNPCDDSRHVLVLRDGPFRTIRIRHLVHGSACPLHLHSFSFSRG